MSAEPASKNSEFESERELLATCGLNATEQSIVLFLLQNRRSTAGIIARRTGIKRPTVYSALINLEIEGLVAKQSLRGSVYYSAISPRTIPIVLKNKARERFQTVETAAKVLEEQLPLLTAQAQQNLGGYEISVIESADAVNGLLENAITAGNYCGIFNPQTAFAGSGKEIGERFLEKASGVQPRIKEIAVAGPLCDWYLSQIDNPNHTVVQVTEDQTLPIDFILLDDTVIVTTYNGEDANAIVVKHEAYCHFMKMFFDMLWHQLTTVPQNIERSGETT